MENLFQPCFSDVAGVANIEVVKSKKKILWGEGFLLINCRRKELAVANLAVLVVVYAHEDIC